MMIDHIDKNMRIHFGFAIFFLKDRKRKYNEASTNKVINQYSLAMLPNENHIVIIFARITPRLKKYIPMKYVPIITYNKFIQPIVKMIILFLLFTIFTR